MENNYEDILEIAKELGNIRFKLIELKRKESEYEENFNKVDKNFLHEIEFGKDLTAEEKLKKWEETYERLGYRRNTKNRKVLIQSLLDGIKIKSPLVFTNKIVESGVPFDKAIEILKKDEKLWKQD